MTAGAVAHVAPGDAAPPAPGTRLGGRYRLDRLVARGGVGAIWRAVDEATQEVVAVKLAHPSTQDVDAVARLQHEARMLAHLAGSHVVGCRDDGTHAGTGYLVLDYLGGRNLAQVLAAGASVASWGVARAVARALAAVHARGGVHGDLKPQHVMLSDDRAIPVTLVDFGEASADGEPPGTCGPRATPAYLAPEVAAGARRSPASDLFALGVLLERLPDAGGRASGAAQWTALVERLIALDPDARGTAAEAAAALVTP
ncbi:MAG: protein kinase [Dehalococcoidia bacterium]